MKNLSLISALLLGTAMATSFKNPLVRRQDTEPVPCDELDVEVTCCADGYTYCDVDENCFPEGCCPKGEVCGGPPAGTDHHTITSYYTETETLPGAPEPTDPAPTEPEPTDEPSIPSIPPVPEPSIPTGTDGPSPPEQTGAASNNIARGSVLGLLSGLAALFI